MRNLKDKLKRERKRINKRLARLVGFLESEQLNAVSSSHQDLLEIQATAMATYSNVLGARIQIIKDNK